MTKPPPEQEPPTLQAQSPGIFMTLRLALRSRVSLWVLWPLYIISQGTIALILEGLDLGSFWSLQWTTDPLRMREILQGFTDAGTLDVFISHFYLDTLHPLFYVSLLAAYTTQVLDSRGLSRLANWLYWLPITAGLLDMLENGIHLYFAQNLDHITPTLALVAGSASMTKWTIAGLDVIILLLLALRPLSQELGELRERLGHGGDHPQ